MDQQNKFGHLDGKEVSLFTLHSGAGLEATISDYGGIVTSLIIKDRNGVTRDVVLGFSSLADYLEHNLYFGCLVGRYANRIGRGEFELDGKKYTLVCNNGHNHLHGGVKGFDKVVWDATLVNTADKLPGSMEPKNGLELTYISRDGEEGYPGNLTVKVVYSLTPDNSLNIDYSAVTDAPTVVCLTHHGYFNLSESSTILAHELQLRANHYTPVDQSLLPTGDLVGVENSIFDYRRKVRLDKTLPRIGGLDHNFILQGDHERPASVLTAKDVGLKMEMFTTEPAIQVYTGNFLDGSVTGKKNRRYQKYAGICLEAQHFPDSPNCPSFPSVVLRPGELYRQKTRYRFSTI